MDYEEGRPEDSSTWGAADPITFRFSDLFQIDTRRRPETSSIPIGAVSVWIECFAETDLGGVDDDVTGETVVEVWVLDSKVKDAFAIKCSTYQTREGSKQ